MRKVLFVFVVLAATALCSWHTRVQAQSDEGQYFLESAAIEQGVPANTLKIADRVVQAYPVSGVRVETAKVLDPTTGQVILVARDSQGNAVDPVAVEAAEHEARLQKFGRIDPRLHARMSAMKDNTFPVAIWLRLPGAPPQRDVAGTAQTAERAVAGQLEDVRLLVAPIRQRVMEDLTRMGVQAQEPRFAPAVFANLNRGQIERISHHPDVDVIYGTEQYKNFEDDAATTERAHRVWAGGNFGFSTSSRPVVHEDDGISDYNPYLSNANHPVIFYCSDLSSACSVGKNIGEHASFVSGIIAGTHTLYQGIAPKSQLLLSANFQSFLTNGFNQRMVDAFEWARGNLGDPTNMSWGTTCGGGNQDFASRYVDWATTWLGATFTIAAGNTIGCSDPLDPNADYYVSSPGLAWNAITVGSIYDNNNGFWSGDGMSSFSRWVNPKFASGMEKPEVVAVGQALTSTDKSGIRPAAWQGTSFAAPQVAGQVVQMFARKGGQNGWPETNKAAILVSAYHDIVLGSRSKDGVGAVVMNNSDDTYRLNRFYNDSSSGNWIPPAQFDRSYTLSLTQGQTVRVAIAWGSWSTGGSGTDVLGADIDLYVYRPDGTLLASSASFQNAWEMVEFVAPVGGTYTAKAHLFSSVAGWPGTFIGFAWSVKSLPDFCAGVSTMTASGTFTANTTNGPTWFDTYPGVAWNESGREYIRKLTLTAPKKVVVTDTNGSLDLFLIQIPSCATNPIVPTVKAYGVNSLSVNNLPIGSYYIVVDGYNGFVGSTPVTVTLTTP